MEDNQLDVTVTEPDKPLRDGGYGWVVCAASAVVIFTGMGTLWCFGILYIEFLEYFGEGRSKTSWISAFSFIALAISGQYSNVID